MNTDLLLERIRLRLGITEPQDAVFGKAFYAALLTAGASWKLQGHRDTPSDEWVEEYVVETLKRSMKNGTAVVGN